MRKAALLGVVLLLILPAKFAAQDSGNQDYQKSRIVALENMWNEAEARRDSSAISGLLADSFAYTDSDGSFMNKKQFLDSVNAPASREPDQIVNNSMSVQIYGGTAVVTGTYLEKGVSKGKSYSRHGRFTDTWAQQNGAWMCVASQETLIKQ